MSPPRPISDKHRHQLTQARAALARKRQSLRLQISIPDVPPKPKRVRRRLSVTRRIDQPELFESPDLHGEINSDDKRP